MARLLFLFFTVLLFSCSASRNAVKEKLSTETETNTVTSENRITDTRVQSELFVSSKTVVTETIDTLLVISDIHSGNPALDDYLKNNPLQVPVKKTRTENRQEYTTKKQTENSIIHSREEVSKNESRKEEKQNKTVVSERSPSIPGFLYFIVVILIAGAVGWYFIKKKIL